MALERETLDFIEGDGIAIDVTDIDEDTVGIEISTDAAGGAFLELSEDIRDARLFAFMVGS